jgi:SagB-type dehydrogenase family enzyme
VEKKITYPFRSRDLENIHQPFPLTEVQLAYLMGRDSQFELGGVSTHGYFEFSAALNIELLNKSLNKVIGRHPMLRAVLMENGRQRILADITGYEIKLEDLRDMSAEGKEKRIGLERKRMSHYIFDPGKWPLFDIKAFKLAGDISYFCIGFDPLISDGTSIDIIFSEIIRHNQNPSLELPPLNFSFRDYMLALQDLRHSEIYKRDKEYWLGKLADFPTSPALPLKNDPLKITAPIFKAYKKVISKTLWQRLKTAGRGRNITPSALLCTVYAEVLSYWSNQAELAINLTVFNRYPFHEDVDKIVGDFTSLMLLKIDLAAGTSFWERAKKLQETLWDALEHRHYDGLEFMRELSKRDNIKNRAVMPIVFTSMLANDSESAAGGSTDKHEDDLADESREKSFSISQTSQVYIDYSAREANGNLHVNWAYVDNLFEPEVIDSMFEQNIMKLTMLAQGESKPISQLIYKNTGFYDRYNDSAEDIKPALLHQLFSEQAQRTPANTAVENGDRRLTYKELAEKSNRVAHYLRDHGVVPNDLIGVITGRGIATIVNVLGILKAGGAYVPIDAEYPVERREYIYKNSNCKLLLEENLHETGALNRCSGAEPAVVNTPEDLAYVIFTSGSTGRPKGVIITHRAASNTIIDINRKFSVNPSDRILGISSMCFDLSVYDVFGALSAGAALVLIRDRRDLSLLTGTLNEHKITIWNSVPAVMDILAGSLETVRKSRPADEEISAAGIAVEEIYYWSPGIYWNKTGNTIKIGGVSCPGIALHLFPELYFLTQEGITLKKLINAFPALEREELEAFFAELIENRVLVHGILTPPEIFAPQKMLFRDEHSEETLLNPVEYEKFKKKQLARIPTINSRGQVNLEMDWELPPFIKERRSYRAFAEDRKMPFGVFAKLFSVFRQTRRENSVYYYYASAGGLYPIDIYVYIKEGRVENIAGGLYYYSPVNHTVSLLDYSAGIIESAHYPGNKAIFNSSALSVFMVYDAGVTMPRYGGAGYFMAAVDTGIMVAAMTQVSELIGLGLCSIGAMYYDKIKSGFNLTQNQVFMHAVEVGLKPGIPGKKAVEIPVPAEKAAAIAKGNVNRYREKEKDGAASERKFLRLVLLSGDWIPLPLPSKIKRFFPKAEVISLGGATEGSIWSIYYPVKEVKKHWKSIPYGYPLANQKFYVLNYESELCPIGVQGELFIGGVGVAEGYANNIFQTKSSFTDHPVLGRIYRTGDYGVFHKEGYIEFLGRKDQQVKIQGYRIELGEIETCLLRHEIIKKAVVIDRIDPAGKKYLCAYLAAEHELTVSQLRNFLSGKLPDYMMPAYFVYLEDIPLTANGKVNRKVLPEPELKTGQEYAAPRDELDRKLVAAWSEVLRDSRGESSLSIGIDDDFFALGGDSVKAILMTSRLHKELNIKVSVAEIFNRPTVRELSEYIGKTAEEQFMSIKPSEKKDYYHLSAAQKRFYLLHQMGGKDTALNLSEFFVLREKIEPARLEHAFKELIKRHESLRACFLTVDAMPILRHHEDIDFSAEYYELGENRESPACKGLTGEAAGQAGKTMGNFVRPFDLSTPPLFRVRLVQTAGEKQILFTDMHHIISDRISLTILEKEFRLIYSGQELAPLKLQYKDYVIWQNSPAVRKLIKQQESYWLEFFSGELPVLNLPADYSGAGKQDYEGDECRAGLNKELTAKLKRVTAVKDVTLFMMLAAAYYVLLSRLTGKEEIIIGVPVTGRNHDDLRKIIGMFVNIVAIRSFPQKNKTFKKFLAEIKQNSLAAFSNRDYQFESLIDKLKASRDLTRNPLFNTVFNMPEMGQIGKDAISSRETGPAGLPFAQDKKISRYDITMYALDFGETIDFLCAYRTCLFKKSTIEYIMGEYCKVIEQILENDNKLLKEYEIFN